MVHELAALAERKFVSHYAHEPMPDVVIGAAFLQGPIVEGDAVGVAVAVVIVERLRERVEGVQHQAR